MKKFLSILTILFVLSTFSFSKAFSQGSAFPLGTLGINLGLGLGTTGYYNNGDFLVTTFNGAVDYAFLGDIINSNGSISGGGYFGIGGGSDKWDGHQTKAFRFRAGTRGALHYSWVRNLDTYAGLGIGFRNSKYKAKWKGHNEWDKAPNEIDFDIHGFAGVRYILGNFAFYSELETNDFAFFQIGISFVF